MQTIFVDDANADLDKQVTVLTKNKNLSLGVELGMSNAT